MLPSTTSAPLKILLAIENSPYFVDLVNMLIHIRWPAGTSIVLLAVVPEQLPLMETDFATRKQINETEEINRWRDWAATKLLTNHLAAQLHSYGLKVETVEICAGSLVEVALERALMISPDLIIIGGNPFDEPEYTWLNPTPDKLIPYTPHAVLVVRPAKPIYPLNTILAVDDSPEAWQAINFVRTLSLPDWARVTLLYLDEEPDSVAPDAVTTKETDRPTDTIEAFAQEAISYMHDCGISVHWLRRPGQTGNELLSVAREQDADLIVLGTKHWTPVKTETQPNLTKNILTNASCSVLVVRHMN